MSDEGTTKYPDPWWDAPNYTRWWLERAEITKRIALAAV